MVTALPEQPTAPTSILVIEDDPALVRVLRRFLTASGYEVWSAATGAEACALLGQRQPALILLDLGLPDTDGLVLMGTLKTLSSAAILILTARAEQVDRVLGLKLGADDFMAKPFDDEELLARIAAVLRRARPRPPPPARPSGRVQVGQLTLARGGGPAMVGSRPVHLTPTEQRLLLALADHADQVVSRARLLQQVWGYQDPSAGHLLDVHLGRLRLKLARAKVRVPTIVTMRGRGYTLVSRPAPPGGPSTGSDGAASASPGGRSTGGRGDQP